MLQRNVSPSDHILSYAQTLRGGGVERALLRLAAGWRAAGRRVTLVVGSAEGPLASEIPEGVAVHVLGTAGYIGMALGLARITAELRPDLIFCPGNHYSAAAVAPWLWLGHPCPPIVGKLSNALERPDLGPVVGWAYRRWLRLNPIFLEQLVAMTPGMAEEAARVMRMPRDRIGVIANPPAMARADAAPVALPEGRFVLGVGRLEPQKRWDRLIAALPRLADRELRLVILGEGSLRGALEAQAAALGLADRVALPGHAADPMPAIARAALVALTSNYEGVPAVLREAVALGTPVVATDASVAVREIIATPALGSVVARDDTAALVAAIDQWLSPEAVRPVPPGDAGQDSIADYLALFDRVVAQRSA